MVWSAGPRATSGLPLVFVNKDLLEHCHAHSCFQSGGVAAKTIRAAEPKRFTIWPFTGKACHSLVKGFQTFWLDIPTEKKCYGAYTLIHGRDTGYLHGFEASPNQVLAVWQTQPHKAAKVNAPKNRTSPNHVGPGRTQHHSGSCHAKISQLNWITRKHQANPNPGTVWTVTGLSSHTCQGHSRQDGAGGLFWIKGDQRDVTWRQHAACVSDWTLAQERSCRVGHYWGIVIIHNAWMGTTD